VWVSLKDNKCYVGSSSNLSKRFSWYFSFNNLNKVLENSTSIIARALLKYGYSGFRLYILEYCDAEQLIAREQYYINLLSPQYNILQVAGSSLGTKLSEATLNL
jgi:group I intron endonuclease